MLFRNATRLIANGATPVLQQKRRDVLEMLTAAVDAVDPYRAVARVFQGDQLVFPSESFDLSSFDHVYVVGFGKASVKMASAVCDAVPISRGVVVTTDASAKKPCRAVEVIVGGHPLPSEQSIQAADQILHLLQHTGENDCVLVLISGGGSALFCKPRIPLPDLKTTTDLLLRSGATIEEMNTIRKHLSVVKGGQLAAQIPGIGISLVLSDIIGDPLSSIASGPTVPDPTTFADAKGVLERHQLWMAVPETVRSVLSQGCAGGIPETLKKDHVVFQRMFHYIVANNEAACRGAQQKAEKLGYHAVVLTTSLSGEAREVGRYLVKQTRQSLSNVSTVFIAGGEPTVTVHGSGSGGRNQELVLSCVEEIAGSDLVIASCATDGIDGNSTAAGALADGQSLARAQKKKLQPQSFLEQNDSSSFFEALHDCLLCGPTGTNVMDVQVLLR